ncbi:CocE/NonD family hydrolase [Nocardioides anomalus]|uniref:CocE/NonD family hydrolase n=1 Tax=Nocardioides anomalus TaxID=2712223 RepID=A0A6G6WA67_9ACTN|nr:CocE/NonD family hydrolase [Nocardioides anomalus]QIG42099.1 CocE/NonD family hydrolase [Nocardioides anomalus]
MTLRSRAATLALVVLAATATTLTPGAPAAQAAGRAAGRDAHWVPGPGSQVQQAGGWRPRPEQYAGTQVTQDVAIPMSDGVVLRGDVVRPTTADGAVVTTPLPVVITITAYNKTLQTGGGGLAGPAADYLVERGYVQLTVDARGTGSSAGVWEAFSPRETQDYGEVVDWAHRQPWSNGKSAMTGPSYMGIAQLYAAAAHPKGLKAIFPQVPGADTYRDIVASGGALDVSFIPLWMGLVTAAGLVPPAYGAQQPAAGFGALLDRLATATTFTVPLLTGAVLGQAPAYDGPFYADRSPINVVDRIKVPTFLVSGEYDLFQRGTPLLYERLQAHGVPVRMITGPWDHLQGSSGADVGQAGYGSLQELQLRWFDHYVKGVPDPRLLEDIKPFTYYEQGSGRWVTTKKYVSKDLRATSFRLSGSAAVGGQAGGLTQDGAQSGTSTVPPLPVTGLCTRSANQWTAGILHQAWPDSPCLRDNRVNDLGGLTFQTEPLTAPLRVQGPINVRLYTSTPTGDGMYSVAVEDVAPDGTVSRLTGGWQTLSQRALDESRSRYLDGQLVQPYHPFTRASQQPVPAGAVVPVDVEVFPTGAAILPGHRLRLSVQAFDVPHLLPTAPNLPQIAPLTLHTGPAYPSVLTVPVR